MEADGRLPVSLDDVDRAILSVLRDEGRISIPSLAERVRVSRTNAYARLNRLIKRQVVEGFSARINSGRAGLPVTAVIQVRVRQPAREALAPILNESRQVVYAAFVTGDYDLVVIARAADITSLRDGVVWRLEQEEVVVSTKAAIVLDEVLNRPYVVPW